MTDTTALRCLRCNKTIHVGRKFSPCADGEAYCHRCAPTYEDMRANPEMFCFMDESPMSASDIEHTIREHIKAGGDVTDKILDTYRGRL